MALEEMGCACLVDPCVLVGILGRNIFRNNISGVVVFIMELGNSYIKLFASKAYYSYPAYSLLKVKRKIGLGH